MIHVFYGDQYCGSFVNTKDAWTHFDCPNSDVYQGGIMYWPHEKHKTTPWFKMDLTPIIPDDVPAKLKMLAFIHIL